MAFDEGLAERVRDAVRDRREISDGKMFGGLAFMSRGNMFVGILGDALMARVGLDHYADALHQPGARKMDFTGKPMKGYVFVAPHAIEDDSTLDRWIAQCLAFVGSLGLIHQRAYLRACLRRLRQHLNPNATLLVELVDAATFESGSGGSGSRTVNISGDRSITYAWRSTSDQHGKTIHYYSRYQLRDADTLRAEEAEELVLKLYTPQDVARELHLAGFSGTAVVPTTSETSWLRESGCSLYECRVPGNYSDA